MNSNQLTQHPHQRAGADYLRHTLTALLLLALLFIFAGVVVVVTHT